jgi:DNA modification methylase
MKQLALTHTLYQGDCLSVMPTLGQFDCIFADPFDNIGLGYDEHDDRMPDENYIDFLAAVIHHTTKRAPIVWLSFNAKWTFAMGELFHSFLLANQDWEGKACQQVFTFGQHNKNDLGNNHRPLWRLKRKDAPLYPEQIKVPSWRQLNGDKRAAPGGRVPSDVFTMQYPQSTIKQAAKQLGAVSHMNVEEAQDRIETVLSYFQDVYPGDAFDFPRVTGNSKQRRSYHPTQLHEELVERCIKLSTREYGTVLDPFGGTGTTLRACKNTNRSCTMVEKSAGYCAKIREEHPDLVS